MGKQQKRPVIQPNDVPPLPTEPARLVTDQVDDESAATAVLEPPASGETDPADGVSAVDEQAEVILLEVPISKTSANYARRHISNPLPANVAEIYGRLAVALSREGATLQSGKAVVEVEHAIIYVAEQLLSRSQPVK